MYHLGIVEGSSGAQNGNVTGVSGALPFLPCPSGAGRRAVDVWLVPSVSGLAFEFRFTGVTNPTRGAPLAGPNLLNGPYRIQPGHYVAIYNVAGGGVTVKVYGQPAD